MLLKKDTILRKNVLLCVNVLFDRTTQNESGKQRKIEIEQLKMTFQVFNKSVVLLRSKENTVNSLFDGKGFLSVSMLFFF